MNNRIKIAAEIYNEKNNIVLELANDIPIYHLSESNLDGKILKPRIPENFMTRNGYEENKTPRISFSTSIDGALIGISGNLKDKEFYIHQIDTSYSKPNIKKISNKEVPDQYLSDEIWVLNPVKLKVTGKIKVKEVYNKPVKYKYGKDMEAETYRWRYIKEDVDIIEESYYHIANSKIAGKGTFASEDLKKDTIIGTGFIRHSNTGNPDKDFKRTSLGAYTNHSNNPNCNLDKSSKNNKDYYKLVAKRNIRRGEELSVDYRQFDFEGERSFVKESFILEATNEDLSKLDTPEKLLEYMSTNIEYGYLTRRGKIELEDYNDFYHQYRLQSPRQVVENRVGVCWDQVELERYIFSKYIKLPFETYYIVCNNIERGTHTFLIYKKDNKSYYFENSYEKFRGIKEFNNTRDIIKYVGANVLTDNPTATSYETFKYNKPRDGSSVQQFMDHCENK